MRPKTISKTGVGAGQTYPVDYRAKPFELSFACTVTGTATYSVQHTLDDPYQVGGPVTWIDHQTVVAQTGTKDGNYAFPVRAIRINVTAGTGTVNMTVIQAPSP